MEQEPSEQHCSNEGKADPRVQPKGHCQQCYGCDHPTLLRVCQAAPGALFPVQVPTIQKRHREGLEKGHKNNQKSGELAGEKRLKE